MKISEIQSAEIVPAKAGTGGPVGSAAPVERISTTQSASLQQTVAQVQSLAPADRASRVAEIARAVKAGQYPVNAQAIAQSMVDDAELDARLQSILNK